MKKLIIIFSMLNVSYLASSQNYDLIETTDGDSIACYIDSTTVTDVYLRMKVSDFWINTHLAKGKVTEIRENFIEQKRIVF